MLRPDASVAADRNVAAKDVENEGSGGRKRQETCAMRTESLPFNIAYSFELNRPTDRPYANFLGNAIYKVSRMRYAAKLDLPVIVIPFFFHCRVRNRIFWEKIYQVFSSIES